MDQRQRMTIARKALESSLFAASISNCWSADRPGTRSEARSHCHECGERIGLHFAHDTSPVGFDSDLTDAQVRGDQLIEPTSYDMCHDLAFP